MAPWRRRLCTTERNDLSVRHRRALLRIEYRTVNAERVLLVVQGAVYVATGVWSVVSRRTFELVTGPKVDYWLVRMVGLLATVIGAVLLFAARSTALDASIWILAIASAASFAAIDLRYALSGRISRIYLLDAVFEIVLGAGLAICWWLSHRG
jgi:hypothetical protein